MIHILLNIFYVLISIAMIVLILLQRGAGAAAGSGFGAGASGTVFGARGSANFLSSSTKVLATLFFALSLFMAWQASREIKAAPAKGADLGIMSELPDASAPKSALPAGATLPPPASVPAAPAAQPVITPAPTPAAAPATAPPDAKTAPAPTEGSKGG